MRVVIYGSPTLGALPFIAEGLEALGHSVTWLEDRAAYKPTYAEPERFDMAVTDGLREPMQTMCREYTELGMPVIVGDLGYLNRETGYLQVGLNQLNWLPVIDCPSDRLDSLELDFKDQSGGDYVLITGQKPYDGQHHMGPESLKEMYSAWVSEIRKHTDRKIVFRPHPLCYDMRIDGIEHDIPKNRRSGGLAEAMAGAHCVVTYNSTSATDAIMAGKPVFCHQSAQVSDLANDSFSDIESPWFPSSSDILRLFSKIAYAQWLPQEIQSGEAVKFVLENWNAHTGLR